MYLSIIYQSHMKCRIRTLTCQSIHVCLRDLWESWICHGWCNSKEINCIPLHKWTETFYSVSKSLMSNTNYENAITRKYITIAGRLWDECTRHQCIPLTEVQCMCVCVCVCVWGGGGGSIPLFLLWIRFSRNIRDSFDKRRIIYTIIMM